LSEDDELMTDFLFCRLVARVNFTHTIGDVRRFINAYVSSILSLSLL